MRKAIASSLILATSAKALIFPRDHGEPVTVIPLTNYNNQAYLAGVRMGQEGNGQNFRFALSSTLGYTVVAGTGCTTCAAPGAPRYDPSVSKSFVAPPAGSVTTVNINGKRFVGPMGIEDCALEKQGGAWWTYPGQRVIVAGSDSDSNGFTPPNMSGIAGLGQSGVNASTDTLVGQYLALHPNVSSITISLALNGMQDQPSGGSSSGSDSDGGQMHLFNPDPTFFEGTVSSQPVISQNQLSSITKPPPGQISSYDWTTPMGGWSFQVGGSNLAGGQGTFTTIEPAYPFMAMTQMDAYNIYAMIPGALRYQDPDTSTLTWSIPCSTTSLSMTVSFGGVAIPISPSDLFTRVGDTCVGNLRGWADPARTTYVFGSSFMRNAYVVFTANNNPQQNTLGFAKRLRQDPQTTKSQAGIIAGSVVGGVAFLAILGLGVFFFLRRKRNAGAPSAQFAASSEGHSTEKRASFFGFGPKEKNVDNLVAEPWTPPPTEPGVHREANGDVVTVQALSPNYGVDQPFLAPGSMSPHMGGTHDLHDNRMSYGGGSAYGGSTVAPSSAVLPVSAPPTSAGFSDSATAPSYYASNASSGDPPNPYQPVSNYRPDGNTTMWISSRGDEKK